MTTAFGMAGKLPPDGVRFGAEWLATLEVKVGHIERAIGEIGGKVDEVHRIIVRERNATRLLRGMMQTVMIAAGGLAGAILDRFS